jgi:hypothetical protein
VRIAELLTAWRHHNELSIRGAARTHRHSPEPLARIEKDGTMSGETLVAILLWQLEP